MWTQKACPCWFSRGGELVVGRGNGTQCKDFWGPVELQTQNTKKKKRLLCKVVAKVAVGDSGRQARLLTEGGETTTKNHGSHNVGCLEFHPGRLDNVDHRSTTKVTGVGTQKGRVVVIAGPTAVGKSRVAIALAKQLGGEIISADSIQVPFILIYFSFLSLLCDNFGLNATPTPPPLLLLWVS